VVLDVTSRLRVSVPTVVCVSVLVAVVLCVSVALVVVETLLVVVGASDTDSDGEGRVVSDVELVPVHFGVRVPLVEVVGVSTISSVREGVVEGVAVVDLEINSVMESSTLFEFVTSNEGVTDIDEDGVASLEIVALPDVVGDSVRLEERDVVTVLV
jgi:hypothetical protein